METEITCSSSHSQKVTEFEPMQYMLLISKPVVLSWRRCFPPWDLYHCLETLVVVDLKQKTILVPMAQKLKKLLNILQYTEQAPKERMNWPKMWMVPSVRIPILDHSDSQVPVDGSEKCRKRASACPSAHNTESSPQHPGSSHGKESTCNPGDVGLIHG